MNFPHFCIVSLATFSRAEEGGRERGNGWCFHLSWDKVRYEWETAQQKEDRRPSLTALDELFNSGYVSSIAQHRPSSPAMFSEFHVLWHPDIHATDGSSFLLVLISGGCLTSSVWLLSPSNNCKTHYMHLIPSVLNALWFLISFWILTGNT